MLLAPTMRHREEAFVVSTWGNDLTLWAARSWMHRNLTRHVFREAHALHTDCERDLTLARGLGFHGPSVVAPGSGGVDTANLVDAGSPRRARDLLHASEHAPIIFNPRADRPYVRNDVFLAALVPVLQRYPDAVAVTVGLDQKPALQSYASALGLRGSVRFLPLQDRRGIADLFSAATLTVSPSAHDGTPNTVLEAMACGSFPIVGDIPSLREWIEPGVNGFAVNPNDPGELAEAMLTALLDPDVRRRAATSNRALVAARASREATRPAIDRLYRLAIRGRRETARRRNVTVGRLCL